MKARGDFVLLLDKSKSPSNTVLYLAGAIEGTLKSFDDLDFSQLLEQLNKALKHRVNPVFYTLALNFLYLLNKIYLDERGIIHVYKQSENNQSKK